MKLNKKMILIIILIGLILSLAIYIYSIKDILNFPIKKTLIKFSIFNFIFIINFLLITNNKTAQYWYIIYILQLGFLIYYNRNILNKLSMVDIIFWFTVLYCLSLLASIVYDFLRNWRENKYEKGIIKQNEFYKITTKKYRWLNNITYLRHVFFINLGSSKIPDNPSFSFWIFHSLLLVIVSFLCWNFNNYLLMAMAIFCLSLSLGYETLYFNYRDSVYFKRNFDANTRFWNYKLSKIDDKNQFKFDYIKREFSKIAREQIKFAAENLGSFSVVNPKYRTVAVIGASLATAALIVTGGSMANTYFEQNGLSDREKTRTESAERIAKDDRESAERIAKDDRESAERIVKDKWEREDKNRQLEREHESKLAKIKAGQDFWSKLWGNKKEE